jgi:hypothetical protein
MRPISAPTAVIHRDAALRVIQQFSSKQSHFEGIVGTEFLLIRGGLPLPDRETFIGAVGA